MKFCNAPNCSYPVFGKGFCRPHQYMREDFDRRSIVQKAMDNHKANPSKPKTTNIRPGTFVFPGIGALEVYGNVGIQCKTEEAAIELEEKYNGVDESLRNLSDDLDAVMSLYIRNKYANNKGLVKCYTCTAVLPIKEIHCGHYVKRGHKATRFLESNLRPQCPSCNQDHNYDEMPYTNALESETTGITAELRGLAKGTYKATRSQLKMQLIEYRIKLEILKKRYETK